MDCTFLTCEKCNEYYLVKYETGDHPCPKCKASNEIYTFDDKLSDEEFERVKNAYEEIRVSLINNGFRERISLAKIMNLILGE